MFDIIVAIGRNNEIGCENRLLWPLSADLRRFKALTMGHPVVMGRKTWESLPKRPLPGRTNVVITSNPEYDAPGALVAVSLAEAAVLLKEESQSPFIIGGGKLYAEALPLASRLHVTRIEAEEKAADTWFPIIDPQVWQLAERSEDMEGEANGVPLTFRFETYIRRGQ